MADWKPKRFWKSATVVETEDGFTVQLDGRAVRTPAKALLVVPTRALAAAAAAEWDAQTATVDPRTMPVTRSVNAAIDKVAVQHREVAEMLAAYGDADVTCYRAAMPAELIARQAAAWDPLLDWADRQYQARLIAVQGVVHHPQPETSLARLAAPLFVMTAFELTAMHDLISLSGSLVIGLAAATAAWPMDDLWSRSRIDEDWQTEQWGQDDEATILAEGKRRAFLDAGRFLDMTRGE